MTTVRCSRCNSKLQIEDSKLGQQIICPACQSLVTASQQPPRSTPSQSQGVVVTDIRIPFLKLVWFFVKVIVAMMPATLLTVILWKVVAAFVWGMLNSFPAK